MSKPKLLQQANITVADRARQAAGNIDRIADAASGALQLGTPLQLADAIDYDMHYVCDWVERRRGADTARTLRERTIEILRWITQRPLQAPPADLFAKARKHAWSLRQWADDIEAEEAAAPAIPPPAPSTETPPAGTAIPRTGEREITAAARSGPPFQSAQDLIRLLDLEEKAAAAESFLRRYRDKYPDCYRDTEGARRNEPK